MILLPPPPHIHPARKRRAALDRVKDEAGLGPREVAAVPVPGALGKGQGLGRFKSPLDMAASLYPTGSRVWVLPRGTHCI